MPLRIVIDVRHYRDFGIGTYIRNLTAALSQIDQVNHYTLTARPADIGELTNLGSNFDIVPYHRNPQERADHIAYPLFVKNFAPNITHVPLNQVPFFLRKPYVVTIHDMSSFLFAPKRGGLQESMRLFQFRRGLVRADRVIAVSAATRKDVVNLLGIPDQRICTIPNAPDPRFYDQKLPTTARSTGEDAWKEEKRRLLERYQIRYPFLLYAGRIRPHKNLPRLIEAFAVLRTEIENHPEYRDLRLIIIGDEISKHPEVRRAVIQTRTEQNVRFLGFVPFDTLKMFYSCAAAFVFPSLYEGFGLPPLEAMASGTPVVVSSVSSLPEVVGQAAVVVHPENPFDIARGMREVLLDDSLRERLIAHGHEQARMFTWRRSAEQVLRVYTEVARR